MLDSACAVICLGSWTDSDQGRCLGSRQHCPRARRILPNSTSNPTKEQKHQTPYPTTPTVVPAIGLQQVLWHVLALKDQVFSLTEALATACSSTLALPNLPSCTSLCLSEFLFAAISGLLTHTSMITDLIDTQNSMDPGPSLASFCIYLTSISSDIDYLSAWIMTPTFRQSGNKPKCAVLDSSSSAISSSPTDPAQRRTAFMTFLFIIPIVILASAHVHVRAVPGKSEGRAHYSLQVASGSRNSRVYANDNQFCRIDNLLLAHFDFLCFYAPGSHTHIVDITQASPFSVAIVVFKVVCIGATACCPLTTSPLVALTKLLTDLANLGIGSAFAPADTTLIHTMDNKDLPTDYADWNWWDEYVTAQNSHKVLNFAITINAFINYNCTLGSYVGWKTLSGIQLVGGTGAMVLEEEEQGGLYTGGGPWSWRKKNKAACTLEGSYVGWRTIKEQHLGDTGAMILDEEEQGGLYTGRVLCRNRRALSETT
eukprot:jgi/Psemu1/28044/gm1.28044_g